MRTLTHPADDLGPRSSICIGAQQLSGEAASSRYSVSTPIQAAGAGDAVRHGSTLSARPARRPFQTESELEHVLQTWRWKQLSDIPG